MNVKEASTEQLRKELTEGLQLTTDKLYRLADIWRELESRGEDLKAYRGGIGWVVAEIAAGKLLAEIVVHLSGQTTKIKAASTLSLEDQRKVMEGTLPLPLNREYKGTRVRDDGDHGDRPIAALERQIVAAGPKDAARLVLELVRQHSDPQALALHLRDMLSEIAEKKRKAS